jgi:hypothetical protein
MTEEPKLRASQRALLTELGVGTGVLLDMDSNFYFSLNETAIFVWKLISAPAAPTRAEVAARLAHEFEVDAAQAAADLESVLDTLLRERLVSVG